MGGSGWARACGQAARDLGVEVRLGYDSVAQLLDAQLRLMSANSGGGARGCESRVRDLGEIVGGFEVWGAEGALSQGVQGRPKRTRKLGAAMMGLSGQWLA